LTGPAKGRIRASQPLFGSSGFCKEKLGRHSEAVEASRRAVVLRPSAESYFNIGLANYYLKQYRESEQAYRQAIKLDPYNAADSYYALGLTYRDSGQFDDEIQAWARRALDGMSTTC